MDILQKQGLKASFVAIKLMYILSQLWQSSYQRGEYMLIIYNKKTKEFLRWYGFNSKFPNGEFSKEVLNLRDNEDYIKIPDDSAFAKLILTNINS